MKQKTFSLTLLATFMFVLLVMLSGCGCKHEWQDATCTTPKTCNLCMKVEGEPLGHTVVIDDAIAATCTVEGVTEGQHCEVCNEILVPQTQIKALGHNNTHYDGQTPSCTTAGWEDYDVCSVCGYSTYNELAATGHSYDNWTTVKNPTCITTGEKSRNCTCGAVETKELPAVGHNYGEWTTTKYPGCTTKGEESRSCACGSTETRETNTLGHSFSSATCTSPETCWNCGATNGSALGHNFNDGSCYRCGEVDPNYVTYGQVHGQLTYQYNKFVGTRGDNGAKVMLIPINDEVKNFDNHLAAMFVRGTYDSGIIVTKCDGYGNFDFGNIVPTGKYIIFCVSANATAGSRFNDEEAWKTDIDNILGGSFSDSDMETLYSFIGYQDYCWDILTIEEGDSWNVTNDFGYTYI